MHGQNVVRVRHQIFRRCNGHWAMIVSCRRAVTQRLIIPRRRICPVVVLAATNRAPITWIHVYNIGIRIYNASSVNPRHFPVPRLPERRGRRLFLLRYGIQPKHLVYARLARFVVQFNRSVVRHPGRTDRIE